ncbi:MFS transporter [Francisella sp. Scap27]|uniref:MFS transporter n=1 Tax=Francisella sp. Scap27 TaxID=2589986 RepID=UPI0015BB0E1D|nr:MFS transporter [Francisella sp. Scap27]QLE79487.1 MFS transporter [Francisella sp. Scap27]
MPDQSYLPNKKSLIILAWTICLVVTLNYSYDFFIRAAPGVMSDGLMKTFKIDHAQIGWLSSAYFISYTVMQIPAGIFLDKYNRKWVISIATLLCVCGNFLFSATDHYWVSVLGRVLMGVGSAFGFIGAAKMAAMWLPKRFFASFMSFTTMIGILGGLFTDTVLSYLVGHLGWREGNGLFTYIGVGIIILILLVVKDNEKFIEYHKKNSAPKLVDSLHTTFKMFTNSKFWAAAFIGSALFLPINVLGSLWGVGLIQTKFGLSETNAAYINSILFVGTAIGFGAAAIISAFTTRYRLLFTISLISMIIISIVLIYIPISQDLFIILYFLLGLMSGTEAITFTVGRAISPPGTSGASTAGLNMINNIIPVILLPGIGYLLINLGTQIGPHTYSIGSYHKALAVIVAILVICLPMNLLLPKNIRL